LLSAHLAATTPRAALGGELGIVYGAFFFGTILASPFAGTVGAALGLRAAIGVGVVAFVISTALTLRLRHIPPAPMTVTPPLPRSFWRCSR